MIDDDYDEEYRRLIGDPPPREEEVPESLRLARENRSARIERTRTRMRRESGEASDDRSALLEELPVTTLAKVFGVSFQTAQARLSKAAPDRFSAVGTPLFTIRRAAPYLLKVDSESDIALAIEKMKPKDLPKQLSKAYWDAKLARQKFEIKAAELWYSEDVIDVLGEAFKTIKNQMQLWVDNLSGVKELDTVQRNSLTSMVDGLAQDLHDVLVDMPKNRKTPSSFARDLEESEDD